MQALVQVLTALPDREAALSLAKEAEVLAQDLAAAAPIPVALTKSLINREAELSIEASLEREAESQARCITSEDHREAVAAFLEKRPPKYSGR